MKLEAIIKRVSLARKSKIKHTLPYENFYDRISSVAELGNFIEASKADRGIRLEARNYFIVVCASGMEIYFKRMAQVFIDAKWVKDDFMDILKEDKVSLADVLEINKRKLSLGEIISVSRSFQDLESINRIYSKMLGVTDFLKEVETFEVEIKKGRRTTLKNDYPDFRKQIGELLNLRHLIIHHEGFKGVVGLRRLSEMAYNLFAFIFAADDYILNKIPEN
jgi:hypothetical protein